MLKCLMLDVDGVLVTGRPTDGRRWNADLEADLGIDANWLGTDFFAKHWDDIIEGRDDLVPRLQACLDQSNTNVRADVLINYWFKMDSRIEHSVLADSATLRQKGVLVYLATNQEHCRARYLLNDMGLEQHIDGIFYSAAIGVTKPNAGFYASVERAVRLLPSEIMLVDDLMANIVGARHAGWYAHHWDGRTSLLDAFAL